MFWACVCWNWCVFFTVLSIHWSTCRVSSFLRLRMLKTMIFTVFSDLSGFRSPPPQVVPLHQLSFKAVLPVCVYGQGGMGNDRSRGTLIGAGPILSSPWLSSPKATYPPHDVSHRCPPPGLSESFRPAFFLFFDIVSHDVVSQSSNLFSLWPTWCKERNSSNSCPEHFDLIPVVPHEAVAEASRIGNL